MEERSLDKTKIARHFIFLSTLLSAELISNIELRVKLSTFKVKRYMIFVICSPHGQKISPGFACGACDKYHVCTVAILHISRGCGFNMPTKKKGKQSIINFLWFHHKANKIGLLLFNKECFSKVNFYRYIGREGMAFPLNSYSWV